MRGTTVMMPLITPPTLTPITQSQSAKVACSIGPMTPTPALLQSRSMGPSPAWTSSTARTQPSRSVTSSLTGHSTSSGRSANQALIGCSESSRR